MEQIDTLVEKEKSLEFSSDEDRASLYKEIREVGRSIYLSGRKMRKATSSPGARFHMVLDSQQTSSCPKQKQKRLREGQLENGARKIGLWLSNGWKRRLTRKEPQMVKWPVLVDTMAKNLCPLK